MDYIDWMNEGIKNGWAGPALCFTHDGLPTTAEEDALFEEGDPCVHIIRLYETSEEKLLVEQNHSPSVWRQNG